MQDVWFVAAISVDLARIPTPAAVWLPSAQSPPRQTVSGRPIVQEAH
jgi:hypothetical protein